MIVTQAGLLLAVALLVQEAQSVEESEYVQETAYVDEDGAFGWSCWVPVAIGRYKGRVSRAYHRKRRSVYTMQIELPQSDNRHPLIWAVDPSPGGSAKPRARLRARAEADAFRFGPASVGVDFKMDAEVVGSLWIRYWGDGAYAGTDLHFNPRQVRRWVGKGRQKVGIGATITPAVTAKLASARMWTAVLTDSTGRRLATEVFEVPSPKEAEASFRKARAAIDALEPHFSIDHRPRSDGGADCSDHNDPMTKTWLSGSGSSDPA